MTPDFAAGGSVLKYLIPIDIEPAVGNGLKPIQSTRIG